MNYKIIPPDKGLIDEALDNLTGLDGDYSAEAVVFPGKRPSHFLRKAIGQRRKGAFMPPLLFSMDEFVDYLYEKRLGIYDRKTETIDAAAILYNIHRKNPLGGGGPPISADIFFPLGLRLYRDFEEFCIEKIPHQKVRETELLADEKIPKETLKNLQSLSLFYKEFYETLAKSNLSTRSIRYRVVSERVADISMDGIKKVIFAGFFALTKSEKDLFTAFAQRDNALFIFQRTSGIAQTLTALGIADDGDDYDEKAAPPAIKIYRSPDTHGQVFALSRLLNDNPDHRDERTVVALPSSETVFPILHHGISMLEANAYNVSLGYPLLRTPVFGFFDNLIELVLSLDGDRLYMPSYVKFILHPYTKNIYFNGRADATRVMFHTLEEILTDNSTKTFLSLDEIEEDEKFIDSATKQMTDAGIAADKNEIRAHLKAIHNKTIRSYMSFRHTGDFASKTIALIEYIYEHSTARLHPFFFPFSEAFTLAAYAISNSMMRDIAFAEPSGYFNLFKRYVATCYCPFEGMPLRGVQILGFLETRNIKFDNVYIMDVNEDTLPNLTKEDSLLPFKARQGLGLPTHIDKERLSASYFETLIAGAKEVHIFFVENNKKEKSRFIEKIIWHQQKKDRRQSDTIIPIQYTVDLKNNPPSAIDKTPYLLDVLKGLNYSATTLNTWLKCPLQFYYQHVLKIEKKEHLTGSLEKIDIGNFIHAVLYEYFKPHIGKILCEGAIDEVRMLKIVNAKFEVIYGQDAAGAVYLLKKQLRQRMSDFLIKYTLPLIQRHEVKILALEEQINHITHRGYNLKGRLDRVELRDGKDIFITDYKITADRRYLEIHHERLDSKDKATWPLAVGTIQMPFYLLLYALKTGRSPQDLNGAFIQLGRTYMDEAVEIPLFKEEGQRFEPLLEVINGILDDIHDPNTPFIPTTNSKDICPQCQYKYMCGM
ncbi:MAG: PD-(D/E)XK nuclease family protein [Candidatus Magnetominusculus sp. LBB02]|nr:PD-(D/E)XK nuclease family protein [Candidatus Magnetominusculus sp. LBB02]